MSEHVIQISKRRNNFTLLRFLAALFVVISHSYDLLDEGNEGGVPQIANSLISFSRVGLIMFFFISGLLITESLMTSSSITHFLWKRVLRIYPALIVLIIITIFVIGPIFTTFPLKSYFQSSKTWEYFIGGITLIKLRFYLPGVFKGEGVNGSLWSLPVEFRLYLMLLLLFIITNYKKSVFLFLIVFVFLFLLFFSEQNKIIFPTWFVPYTYWGSCFFFGSFVYLLKEKIRVNKKIFICLLITWIVTSPLEILYRLFEMFVICYVVLLIGYKFAVIKGNFFSENDYSYSIYIYSFPIQKIIIEVLGTKDLTPLSLFSITIVLLFPFCWFSWNYIEKPCLKLKNRFFYS